MTHNMSLVDRYVRATLGLLFICLYISGVVTGTLGLVLLVVAAMFLITSFINYCPLYPLLGIRRWEAKRDSNQKA